MTNEYDGNQACCYEELSSKIKNTLLKWIQLNFEKSKRFYYVKDSYGLKHDFERDTGIYVTNGQFKGAMGALQFIPDKKEELNWYFKMRKVIQ